MTPLKLEVILNGIDKITKPIKQAMTSVGGLDEEVKDAELALKKLNKQQKKMDAFKNLKTQSKNTSIALKAAKDQTKELALALKSTDSPTKTMINNFERAKNKVNRLKKAQQAEKQELQGVRLALNEAGLSTRRFTRSQNQIAEATRKANRVLDTQGEKLKKLKQQQRLIGKAKSERNRILATQANINFVSQAASQVGHGIINKMTNPMQQALDFESSMADVRKVTNFSPKGLQAYSKELEKLTWAIPLMANELAQISASGGQLGIKESQLLDFTKLVAKMSTAYDMIPDEAGDATAKLMNVYKLTIGETQLLGDAINHLSDNSAAKAREMIEALGRVGGVAKQFGLTEIQAAALTNAFIAMGKPPQVAATAINSMLQRLQTAPKQGKKFQKALQEMGISSTQLAQDIENNPQKALSNFLKILGKVDKTTRAGLTVDLFGTEYSDDVSLLVGNLDQYQKSLDLTAKKEMYLGSIQKEFDVRASTRANKLALLSNKYDGIKRTIGNFLLDSVMPLIDKVGTVLEKANIWIEQNRELATTIAQVALVTGALLVVAGSLGIAMAAILGPLAMARYLFAVLGIKGFKLGTVLMWLGRTVFPLVLTVLRSIGVALMANPIGAVIAVIAGGAYLIYRNWDSLQRWWNSWTLGDIGETVGEFLMSMAYKIIDTYSDLMTWWASVELSDIKLNVRTEAIKWALKKGKEFVKWWNGINLKSIIPDIKIPDVAKTWSNWKSGLSRGFNRAEASNRMKKHNYYKLGSNSPNIDDMVNIVNKIPKSARNPANDPMHGQVKVASAPRLVANGSFTDNSSINIDVHASPGMDEEKVAQVVSAKIMEEKRNQKRINTRRKGGFMFDGDGQ